MDRTKSNLKIKKKHQQDQKRLEILKERKQAQLESLTDVDLLFGLDNGSTGTMCAWNLKNNKVDFILSPAKHVLNYQKDLTYIDRIDHTAFKLWIENQKKLAMKFYQREIKVIFIIERPMVNPQRFEASINAVRAFEATIVILEQLNLKYIVIDSKEWQHYFFGKDTILLNLKLESMKLGVETINELSGSVNRNKANLIEIIRAHGDADALLITKYGKEKLIN